MKPPFHAWLCMVIPGNLPPNRHAKTLHGQTWQSATEPPRQDFVWSNLAICHRTATPRLCMVIPGNLPPNRHAKTLYGHTWQSATEPPRQDFVWSYLAICHRTATPRLCMVIPVNLPTELVTPWRQRFDCHWLKAGGQADTH